MRTASTPFLVAVLSLAPGVAPAMPDMQAVQRAMEEAQRCMADVDPQAMNRMAEEAQAFTEELRGLCRAGNRSQAQDRAMAYAMRMKDDPDVRKMRECGEKMREAGKDMPMMPAPPTMAYPTAEEIEASHVCDNL